MLFVLYLNSLMDLLYSKFVLFRILCELSKLLVHLLMSLVNVLLFRFKSAKLSNKLLRGLTPILEINVCRALFPQISRLLFYHALL